MLLEDKPMLTLTSEKSLRQVDRTLPARLSPGGHGFTGTLEMMGASMSYARNEEIYGDGEVADYLYKVVSGAVRIYKVLDDGRRQVGAFYLPGDVFGFEIGDEHQSSAEAIGSAVVLVFKRSTVKSLASRDIDVARQLWTMTAAELQRAQTHSMLLIRSAQERLALFLLEMCGRLSGQEFDLPMSRQDIADYLGLTIETVSRTFTLLESAGAIGLISSRRISVRNRNALSRLSA